MDITGEGKPRELTSEVLKGQTHSPVLNNKADKAAWLELDEDGYESARWAIASSAVKPSVDFPCRAKIVIYDLKKDVRFTLTQKWDRSPEELAVS